MLAKPSRRETWGAWRYILSVRGRVRGEGRHDRPLAAALHLRLGLMKGVTMRLVITGSRHGHPMVEKWLRAWCERRGSPELCVVGDATGVDSDAYRIATWLGWRICRVFVQKSLPSPDRYHDRNARMVAEARAGDWLLAFPSSDSRGTYHCANLARKAGLTVRCAPVVKANG